MALDPVVDLSEPGATVRRDPRSRILRNVVARTVVLVIAALVLTGAGGDVGPIAPAAPQSPGPSPQSYTLAMSWDAATHRLSGTESVTFTNNRSTAITTAYFRLWPNSAEYGASCRRPFITVSGVTGGTVGPLDATCTVLPVTLPAPLTTGKSATIGLTFVDAVPNNDQRFGYSGSYVNLATAFPILAVTDDRGTHLERPPLLGEGQYSLASSFNVTLTIPAGTEAATTGTVTSTAVLADGRKKSTITAPQSRDFAMAIGPYTVTTTTVNGVRLRYFEQRGASVPAATVLRWATEAFASYTSHYGPWYGTELDIAGEPASFSDEGMEYPEMIMTQLVQSTVTHEVAHMWFYAMVVNSEYTEPWLDESLTEFASQRLLRTNSSCNVSNPFGNLRTALDASMAVFDPLGDTYFTIAYTYGPCAIERLRRDWGDARFDQMLTNYVSTYRLKVATTAGWKAKVRQYAPAGYAVDSFFSVAHLTTWPG